jgi:mono/diheme cytochrome c family protein
MTEQNDESVKQHPDIDPVFQMHTAAMREMQEPRDGVSPTPVSYIVICFLYILWGGFYIGFYGGTWKGDGLAERPIGGPPTALPPQDPMKLGREVFNSCMQCHQETGLGVPGSYPPLVGSEYVLGDKRRIAAILLNGISGEFVVKGQTYNSAMPPWATLDDEEIAAVATYVRNTWGNKAEPLSREFVGAVRKEVEGKGEWRAATLEAFTKSAPPTPAAAVPVPVPEAAPAAAPAAVK